LSATTAIITIMGWLLLGAACHHRHPACGVNALRYDTASAAPARAPLFERRDNCASAAVMAPRCLGLLSGGWR